MSANAHAHLQAGLAQGLAREDLLAAAQALFAQSRSQPTIAPPPADATHTVAWLEDHREDAPDHAVTLPTTPAVPPNTPRIEGLSRYDDLPTSCRGGRRRSGDAGWSLRGAVW